MTRRGVLALAVAGGGVAAATGVRALLPGPDTSHHHGDMMIGPHDRLVAETERRRHCTGTVRRVTLTAEPGTVDLAGRTVPTWLYRGGPAGPEVRVCAGDRLRARLVNRLPDPTTVHWHGLRLRNDMDGVPETMTPVAPGGSFDYDFVVPDPGTYWFHSHVGFQRDRGLYAPLIVEDPHERGDHDHDVTIVLDDWSDGVLGTPEQIFAQLRAGRGDLLKPAMSTSSPWGPMLGDVAFRTHLVNGRPVADPQTFRARPGQRIRFRFINASTETSYRIAVGGHRLTVTHADGWAVRPVEVDTLLIGMGERYDVVVTAKEGAFGVVAAAEGHDTLGRAILRTGGGATPPADHRPAELRGRLLSYADLRPAPGAELPHGRPDRTVRLLLSQGTTGFRWLINGHASPHDTPVPVRPGERLQLEFVNASTMPHPMHLHGHTFAVAGTGVRKDTVVVLPGKSVAIDVVADNPGQWVLHCHNDFHMAAGMMTMLSYRRSA